MTKATADLFRRVFSPLLAVVLVLVTALAGILIPLLDTWSAIIATCITALLYVAGLQKSARVNASVGSASPIFAREIFDKGQAAEAKLVALFQVLDEPSGAPQSLVSPIIGDL